MKDSGALCIFVKQPVPGGVKTRMQPRISPRDACRLYKAMVEDLLRRLRDNASFDTAVFYWPPEGARGIEDWLGREHVLVPQSGADLGERISNAFQWAENRLYQKTIVAGSDVPALDVDTIDKAFAQLDASDAVLGPSCDGGYYLVGLKRPEPELFRDVSWGTENVYEETLAKLRRKGLSVAILAELRDMDTYNDAYAYWRGLKTSSNGSESISLIDVLHSVFDGQA